MPVEVFANAANTTLSAAITVAGSTSFTVTSGVQFPTVSATTGTQFRVIIDSELFVVTDSTTATWTVVPAIEGTTAATHLISAPVTAIATATGLGSKTPRYTTVFRTTAYTAVDGDIVVADTTAGSFTVTLPASVAGRIVGIRKSDATANVVTVATASGVIDGLAARPYAYQYQTQKFVCDGTNWQRLDVVGVTAMATTGTPSATTYLRGDGQWVAPAAGQTVTTKRGPYTAVASDYVLADTSSRSVADGATNTNTTVTSVTAAFVASDVGRLLTGGTIPALVTITAVGSATSVTISAAATATATAVTLVIGGPFTVTIPVLTTTQRVSVKNIGTGTVTAAASSGTIDGAATLGLPAQYTARDIVGDGTNLWVA